MALNPTAATAEAKEKSGEAIREYNRYINQGLSAQDAYLKTIYSYAKVIYLNLKNYQCQLL